MYILNIKDYLSVSLKPSAIILIIFNRLFNATTHNNDVKCKFMLSEVNAVFLIWSQMDG